MFRSPRMPRIPVAGSLLSFALILLAAPAAGRELEPAATLEGFPFSAAYSVAITADGAHIYASGRDNGQIVATPGLAWLRRDSQDGSLLFERNYFSAGRSPAVFGALLSADESYLFVLKKDAVETHLRAADGSLSLLRSTSLASDFRPQTIGRLPRGEIYVWGLGGHRIYGADANGVLTFRQSLDGAPLGPYATAIDDDFFISGGAAVKRQGNAWSWQPLSALTSAIASAGRIVASPDRRYFYAHVVSGTFPQISYYFVSLEKVGGQLVEAARFDSPQSFSMLVSAAAVHPHSGHLYVAAFNDDGGRYATLVHYRPVDGGRTFEVVQNLEDPLRALGSRMSKDSLLLSPDGRHLYANFDGEPMALLAIDAATGGLEHIPRAAGPHSFFEKPFEVLSIAPGQAYVLTPYSVLTAGVLGQNIGLTSSLEPERAPDGSRQQVHDLVLTPGGGAGVLATGSSLYFVERERITGELRALAETAVPAGSPESLAISPDGRYVYLVTSSRILVYYLRRDVPKLVPVQEYPQGGTLLRLSGNGPEGLLLRDGQRPLLLGRSVASGELAAATFQHPLADTLGVEDAFFSADGRVLHLFWKAGSEPGNSSTRVERLVRRPGGSWYGSAGRLISPSLPGRRVVDAAGQKIFELTGVGIESYGLVNRSLAFAIEAYGGLDRNDLGGAGALSSEGSFELPQRREPVAFVGGENELLVASPATGNVGLVRRGCGVLAAGRCLERQRFRVEVLWRDPAGDAWPAQVSDYGSDDAQVFTFFDPTNWEMMVKVLDGCAINDRFWVYAAASTDVAFDIGVTDTWTGARKLYRSPAGPPAPAITDGDAFATCDAASPGWNTAPPFLSPLIEAPNLKLSGFEAKVSWTDHAGGQGNAVGLRPVGSPRSGLFYFFDRNNWEMQVKVLDGCAINGNYWVFGAATTDVGYTLEVVETSSGRFKRYSNPVGRASKAITDIAAFSCD